jgi:hypothetical protein
VRWLIDHRWHIFQGSIILGVVVGLVSYFGPQPMPMKYFGLFIGVVAALWVTVVINSIFRLRDLSKMGPGYFRRWIREVWAAEQFAPGRDRRSEKNDPRLR